MPAGSAFGGAVGAAAPEGDLDALDPHAVVLVGGQR
jgi:hypothetical protein